MSIPIFMLSPIFMVIIDRIINKKKVNIGQIISFCLSFIGIVLVVMSKSKVSFNVFIIGLILMITSSLLYSYIYTLLKSVVPRKLEKKGFDENNYELLVFSFIAFIISIIVSIIIYNLNGIYKNKLPQFLKAEVPKTENIIKVITTLFICSYIMNILYFYSYNKLSLSTYGVLENVEVIASLVIGYYLLNEEITPQKILGCAIIMSGIVSEIYFKDKKRIGDIKLQYF